MRHMPRGGRPSARCFGRRRPAAQTPAMGPEFPVNATRPAPRGPSASRPTARATSCSPGRSLGQDGDGTASSRAGSTLAAPARRRVSGQHLHDGRPVPPRVAIERRRRLRRRLGERRPGRPARRRLRPALRRRGSPLGAEFQVNTYTTGYQQQPGRRHGRRGRLRRRLEQLRGQDGDRLGSLRPALRRAPAPPRAASSRSTPTPPSDQNCPRGRDGRRRRLRGGLARAGPGRRARLRHLRPALRRARARPLGGEFQVNTYTTGYQTRPGRGAATRRRLRRRLAELRPGRRRTWHLRAALRRAGAASRRRVPGQHLHDEHPAPPARRRSCPTATSSSPGTSNGQDDPGPGRRYRSGSSPSDSMPRAAASAPSSRSTRSPRNSRSTRRCADGRGGFVIAWDSYGQDGASRGPRPARRVPPAAPTEVDRAPAAERPTSTASSRRASG